MTCIWGRKWVDKVLWARSADGDNTTQRQMGILLPKSQDCMGVGQVECMVEYVEKENADKDVCVCVYVCI